MGGTTDITFVPVWDERVFYLSLIPNPSLHSIIKGSWQGAEKQKENSMIAQNRIKKTTVLKKAAYLPQEKALAKNIAGIICHQLQEEQMALNIVFHPP